MALPTTYDDLIDALVDTIGSEDFRTHAPRCIRFAEISFDRKLYPLDSEAVSTSSSSSATIALPTDFKRLRSFYVDDDTDSVLTQLSPDDFRAKYPTTDTGVPVDFAIIGSAIHLGPAPDAAYTFGMVYVQGFTFLADETQSNWLIETHPDLYYYGSLLHAEAFGWNDERLGLFDNAVDKIIAEIQFADGLKRRGDAAGTVAGSYF